MKKIDPEHLFRLHLEDDFDVIEIYGREYTALDILMMDEDFYQKCYSEFLKKELASKNVVFDDTDQCYYFNGDD